MIIILQEEIKIKKNMMPINKEEIEVLAVVVIQVKHLKFNFMNFNK